MSARSRVAHIDGLRAVAALSVVVFHTGVHSAVKPAPGSIQEVLVRNGCHGVDLFFVLSGFCLAYPVLAALREKGAGTLGITAYAARRLVRILPPYYAAIAVLFAAGLLLLHMGAALPQSMDAQAVSPAGVLLQMLFVGDRYLASSFWTLAIEFRWYALFPIVLLIWTRSRMLFALIAVLSLTLAQTRIHSYDLFFLPVFMLGIVAAEIYLSASPLARLALPALPVAFFEALRSTARDGWYFMDRGPAWGIAMFALVVAIGAFPFSRNLLSTKWMTALGAASYSIYLIHEPVLEWIERLHAAFTPDVRFAAAAAAATLAGLAFSWVAERPFTTSPLKPLLCSRIQRCLDALPLLRRANMTFDLARTPPARQTAGGKAAA